MAGDVPALQRGAWKITTLDLEAARAMPGVKMIVTAEELEASGMKLEMAAASVKNRDGKMAKGRVRYVGDPIAVVVAETLGIRRAMRSRSIMTSCRCIWRWRRAATICMRSRRRMWPSTRSWAMRPRPSPDYS